MPKLGRRSERAELDYKMAPDLLRKDAPFGNNDTPNISMKIIGGQHKPVFVSNPTYNDHYMSAKIQPLQPITDKPNHLDPRTFGDMPGGYYNRDVQNQDASSPRPTGFVNRRPDSKDVSRVPYKALPPIQANRTRNDMSTVFEAEPWTANHKPELSRDTEYLQNYQPSLENGEPFQMHRQAPITHRAGQLSVSDAERHKLLMLLPPGQGLPTDPIRLTDDQQRTLLKMTYNELSDFKSAMLQEIYLFCSKPDMHLQGFCTLQHLYNSFMQFRANISEDLGTILTLIAAQHVDRNYIRMVNYERLIAFIGHALDSGNGGKFSSKSTPQLSSSSRLTTIESSSDKPKYYLDNGEAIVKTGSIYRDRKVAGLLRTVEAELSSYTINWGPLENAFSMLDQGHRETLSETQIRDILREQGIPLTNSSITHILHSWCEGNNKHDGQYRWQAFLDFLGKVQKRSTGLLVPVSKRPLEYAKHFPQPGPNWPRAEHDTKENNDTSQQKRNFSPRREPPARDFSPLRSDRVDRGDYRQDRYNDRVRYSPDREGNSRSPAYFKEPIQASPSPRNNYRSPDPYDVRPYDSRYDRNYEPRNREEPSYRDGPSGYQPSWQQNSPRRSNSPQQQRRNNEQQRSYRDDARYGGERDRDPYRRDTYRGGDTNRMDDQQKPQREEAIRQLSTQIKELETKYNVTKEGMTSNKKSWLDRFLKMAQALYNSDVSNRGSLPIKVVMEIVHLYNDALRLDLDIPYVEMQARAPEHLDKSNNVILRSFLANLSPRS